MTSTSSQITSTGSRDAVPRAIAALPSSRRGREALFVVAIAITGLAALAFAMWLGGDLTQSNIQGVEIGGTGNFTGWGLPISNLVMELATVGVIGMLLACLLLPADAGKQSRTEQRCLRTASRLALVWVLSDVALMIFTWSDVSAQSVSLLPITKLFTDPLGVFPGAADFVSTTAVALMIAVGTVVTETRRGVMILLPLAVYNLVPIVLRGHASHGTVLEISLILHVIAASLWVGGLAALLLHARAEPALLAVAVPRFSTIALGCYIAIGLSGIVAAMQLLGWQVPWLWETRYGVLVMLKIAALIALGIFGWWHRQHTVGRLRAGPAGRPRRAFAQLAGAEVLLMVGAFAIAIALSRTASPDTILLHNIGGGG